MTDHSSLITKIHHKSQGRGLLGGGQACRVIVIMAEYADHWQCIMGLAKMFLHLGEDFALWNLMTQTRCSASCN